MKKILVVSEVFWPENFIINDLVRELKLKGFQVDILTQYPSYPQSYVFEGYKNEGQSVEMWEGSKIYRFKFIEGYKDSFLKKVRNYISFICGGKSYVNKIEDSYDYVFVSQTGPLSVTLPAIKAAKKFDAKLILWVCDIWPDAIYAYGVKRTWIVKTFLNRFISYIYSKCDHIFVSSNMFTSTIREYNTDKEITYIPNWSSDDVQEISDVEFDSSKFNITFTGNISLYQNLEIVVKAFKSIDDSTVLNIIGNGSKFEDVKSLVESENISNVKFFGRKPASHIQDILSKSDALLLSLISDEGIQKTEPFKIQSYLRSGKPILGVIGGAAKEIILENQLGVCATPDNASDIIEKIKLVTKITPEERDLIRQKAENLINTRYNKSKIIKKIIKGVTDPS